MPRHFLSIFNILVILAALSAQAGFFDEVNLSGTFESVYWKNNPSEWKEDESPIYEGPYTSFENNMSLNLDYRKFFAELRLRTMDYKDPIHYDPRSREHETSFELFKATAGYRGEHLKILAGDFYKSVAKGLILYVQEDKDLNLDRTIRGGQITLVYDPIEVTVFGGEIQWYFFKDSIYEEKINSFKINDKIYGGRIAAQLPANITAGISLTSVKLYEIYRDEYESEDVNLGEADIGVSGIGDFLDLYAEYAEMRWDSEEPFGSELEDGKALYASATMYFGPITMLAEYKDYDYWNYRYARPPTADRDDELSEIEDIRGPRLKIDYFISDTDTLVYLSASRFDNHAHASSFGDRIRNRVDHIYMGVEQRWDRLYAHLTYGYTDYVTLDETHPRITSDMEFKINDRNSLNWYYEYKETSAESYEKAEHKTYLTYSFSPYLSATVHYNKHTYKSIYQDNTDDEWFGGELLINPVSGLAISLFYGELPPGMVCSGGQCRIVPEFEGFQASLSYRF